jgi:hypothetical protein
MPVVIAVCGKPAGAQVDLAGAGYIGGVAVVVAVPVGGSGGVHRVSRASNRATAVS